MRLLYSILVFITANSAMASDLTFDFKSPAFSGIGYSSHVLTIEQLEANRKQKIKEEVLHPILTEFSQKVYPYINILFVMYSLNLVL